MKMEKYFFNNYYSYKQLLTDNKKEVVMMNYTVMTHLAAITGTLMILLVMVNICLKMDHIFLIGYLLQFAICLFAILFRNHSFIKNHPLFILYLMGILYLNLSVFMSIIGDPTQKATVILGLFCIVPMLFIDKPWRIDSFIVFFYILHTLLAFKYKSFYIATVDATNCFAFGILGIYVGNSCMHLRLSEIDTKRHAEFEKAHDVLTGLFNRRKLYEQLSLFETSAVQMPTGTIMFDVDKFKMFNDEFGHAAGDECLKQIGLILLTTEAEYSNKIKFYRYGGDEFSAFTYDCDRELLQKIAQTLQEKINTLIINTRQVSISIGISYCGNKTMNNYEKLIESADKELYEAKGKGRNSICIQDYAF